MDEAKRSLQRKTMGGGGGYPADANVPPNESSGGSLGSPLRQTSQNTPRVSSAGSGGEELSKSGKTGPPSTYPKPAKKGILKDKSSYGIPIPNQEVRGNLPHLNRTHTRMKCFQLQALRQRD